MTASTGYKLTVVSGKADQKAYPLSGSRISIGSGPGCDITLRGDGIAPEHAMLQKSGDVFIIMKRGNLPLHIDGKESMQAAMKPGSVVRIGSCELRLDAGSAAAAPVVESQATGSTPKPQSGGSNLKWILLGVYVAVMIGVSVFFLFFTGGAQPEPTLGNRLTALDAAYEQSTLPQRDEVRDLVREALYMESRESSREIANQLRVALAVTLPAWEAANSDTYDFDDPLQQFISREIARHSR